MEFMLGAPVAMLAFLFAPILARRWPALAIIAGVGAALPAAVVLAHGGMEGLAFRRDDDPETQILIAYCAFFLFFFAFPVAARLIGLRLETQGAPRLRLLPLDLAALAPAAGFYATLLLSALDAQA